jgi:hypothetical protein
MERRAFKNDASRVDRVFLASQDPDVLAFYEVESSEIFAGVTATFPGDTFQITEGEESQEILVGVRASKWDGRASQYDIAASLKLTTLLGPTAQAHRYPTAISTMCTL